MVFHDSEVGKMAYILLVIMNGDSSSLQFWSIANPVLYYSKSQKSQNWVTEAILASRAQKNYLFESQASSVVRS
jgi:hypothetical protein